MHGGLRRRGRIRRDAAHAIVRAVTRIGIIGLGYVGLPLAVAFAEVGEDVLGVDIDPRKAAAIADGRTIVFFGTGTGAPLRRNTAECGDSSVFHRW